MSIRNHTGIKREYILMDHEFRESILKNIKVKNR